MFATIEKFSQDRMQAEIDRIVAITLEDLALVYTNHLPVDALQLTVADCHDLGYVLIEKSAGNLFFSAITKRAEIKQVLKVPSREKKMKVDRNGN